jgi:hypothetical protein
LDTITGTGKAITFYNKQFKYKSNAVKTCAHLTKTPDKEQIAPKIFPIAVLGTISPYLNFQIF